MKLKMQINTQQLIITILGVALVLLILLQYNTEVIIAIISGLIGFLTNKTIQNKEEVTTTTQTDPPEGA